MAPDFMNTLRFICHPRERSEQRIYCLYSVAFLTNNSLISYDRSSAALRAAKNDYTTVSETPAPPTPVLRPAPTPSNQPAVQIPAMLHRDRAENLCLPRPSHSGAPGRPSSANSNPDSHRSPPPSTALDSRRSSTPG